VAPRRTVTLLPTTVETLLFAAIGASLMLLIVILTVASAVSDPSLTRYVN
jgi:uncharacterized membrane protein